MTARQKTILVTLAAAVVLILSSSVCCLWAVIPNRWNGLSEADARAQCEKWITQQSTTGKVFFLEDTNEDSSLGDFAYRITGVIDAISADGIAAKFRYDCHLHAEVVGLQYRWRDDGLEYYRQ